MSRRDDRDRSRTRRRRDRSPSSQPRRSRRREHNDAPGLDGMDWNNLVSWQHNSGYNTSSAFPTPSGNYQPHPSSSQQFHYPSANVYMMPFPPEPHHRLLPPQLRHHLHTQQRLQLDLKKRGLHLRMIGNLVMVCLTLTSFTTSACP